MTETSDRLDAVFSDIDAANADDPRTIVIDGEIRSYEIVYSERMIERLGIMYPDASDALKIAARGQHIRRWDIPRVKYEQGRNGYNQWRRACREHHAELLAEIMQRHGYGEEDVAKVQTYVKKEQLKKDRESQALENVVDIVFIEHYLDDFAKKYQNYDEDKMIDIIAKTLKKMSPKGHEAALALDLPDGYRKLIMAAIEREADALAKLAEVAID